MASRLWLKSLHTEPFTATQSHFCSPIIVLQFFTVFYLLSALKDIFHRTQGVERDVKVNRTSQSKIAQKLNLFSINKEIVVQRISTVQRKPITVREHKSKYRVYNRTSHEKHHSK